MSNSIYLREGEEVVHHAHFHWSWILPILLRALAALLLFAGIVYLSPNYFLNTAAGRVIMLAYVFGVLMYIFFKRKTHHMSFLAITSHRVIRVDRHQFFHSSIAEMPFDRIENVRSSVHGFWGTILKFGTIEIYTAGDEGQIVVGHHLADPVHVAGIILKHREEYLRATNLTGAEGHRRLTHADNAYQNPNMVSYIPAMPPHFFQSAESAHKPVEGFTTLGPKAAPPAPKHRESYLVDMIANSDEFRNSVVGSLTDEISGGGSGRGKRLVSAITSADAFKKTVIDELTQELLE
jgi:hypothetical protein